MSDSNGHEPEIPDEQLMVDLPVGGRLKLGTLDEVEMWNSSSKKYIDDYGITKANDLALLGAILSQLIAMFQAQQKLHEGDGVGQQSKIAKAAGEIRELEKALGIDKKSREAGGKHTVDDYLLRVKRAAHISGIRISDRVRAYEKFNNELRVKIRLLRNGDQEDRAYHDVSPESILAFCERRLAAIEEADKKWAKDKGAIFVGKL